jgi:hypothetical protein
MTHLSTELAGRIGTPIRQWLRSRMEECTRCSQCDHPVKPWDSCCSSCGQADPSRLRPSAAAYLVLGYVLLSLIFLNVAF